MKQGLCRAVPLLLAGLLTGPAGAATVTQIPVTEVQSGQQQVSGQSQLLLMVQQLQEEVRQLRGLVETQQYRLNKMEREQRDRYRDLDRRIGALIQAGVESAATLDAPLTAPPAADEATPVAPVASPGAGDDRSAYQAAFALVRERKFDAARSAFEAFIQQYPQSNSLANAHYWIGEIDLAQQSLESARAAFQRVIQDFSAHAKVPDALYKLGVVEDRLGNLEASRGAFQRLLAEYPQSSAAGLARNYTASR